MDEAKRELVRGWLRRASHDLEAARLLGASRPELLGIAAFHCQQAAEKALKGFLLWWEVPAGKTHDLGPLIEKVAAIEPGFGTWRDAADRLTPMATAYRYPGPVDLPDAEELGEALEDSESIVRQVLSYLPPEIRDDLGEGR